MYQCRQWVRFLLCWISHPADSYFGHVSLRASNANKGNWKVDASSNLAMVAKVYVVQGGENREGLPALS